jgi:ATP-dependent RNA helicase DHX36
MPPSLQNGDKGADSHTVSESARIKFTKILIAFRENDKNIPTADDDDPKNQQDEPSARLDFPATLTNTERKFVHEIAAQLGLKSKSHGKGENRCIVVTKMNSIASKKVLGGDDDEAGIPRLRIGQDGADALQRHILKFPPTHTEELEAHETGSSIMEALGGEDVDVANRLQQLGLLHVNDSKESVRVERPETRVNLQRRKRLHAAAQKAKRSHAGYPRMLQTRAQLPAYNHQQEIVKTVAENAITIISGDTGCGKARC